MLISLLYKTYNASNDCSYLAYKYTTLATRQRDVVVVRTALTAATVVPSTMFKVYDPPNSETQKYIWLKAFTSNLHLHLCI